MLIQESTSEFHALPNQYLHYSKQLFNTGLQVDLLQEYLLIPLDIFQKNSHNITNRLDGWLQFLASNSPEDIRRLLEVYPDFAELYREVFYFRYQTKELISMFSEELRILDANTVQYMVETQHETIEQQQETIEQQQKKLQQQQEEIAHQTELAQQEQLARQKAEQEAEQAKQELARLKASLQSSG